MIRIVRYLYHAIPPGYRSDSDPSDIRQFGDIPRWFVAVQSVCVAQIALRSIFAAVGVAITDALLSETELIALNPLVPRSV